IPITSYASTQGVKPKDRTWYRTYGWGWMNMLVRRNAGVLVEAANADLTQAHHLSYLENRVEFPRIAPIETVKPHGVIASIIAERGPNSSAKGKVATWVGGVWHIVL